MSSVKDFIKRVTSVTGLNVKESDFQTLEYKNVLRMLYIQHIIPELGKALKINPDGTYTGIKTITKEALNSKINILRSSPKYMDLFQTKPGGTGPGEIVIFLLVDKAVLSGGSKSYDITAGNLHYEVKSVNITSNGKLYGFATGSTVSAAQYAMGALKELGKSLGMNITGNSINVSQLQQIRQKAPDQYNDIEKIYKKGVAEYFAKHPTIFFGSQSSNSSNRGTVLCMKNVKEEDISIHEVSLNTVKPYVKA